ncbi:hypothetical protein JX266_012305 [Neoarthrinium moseri]|nr:hypothetical protein JX266_012305 [Neoarthrinium moseri]
MRLSIASSILTLALVDAATAGLQKRQAPVTVTETVTSLASSPTAWTWNAGASTTWPIHESCNATERALLKRGLDEAVVLAAHARDHVLRHGNSSEFYQKYFGNASTGEVIGWFEKIVHGDRGVYKFRCDNPDGNCNLPEWGGHWRGENGTEETVICPLSYETRKPLEGVCGYGYTVAEGSLNFYFASDLIHRLFHMPSVGEEVVEHYADDYEECVQLAIDNPAQAVRNTHTLQYFALDVYAFDIALPNDGCTGKTPAHDHSEDSSTTTIPSTATATTTAGTECHTHSDGTEHYNEYNVDSDNKHNDDSMGLHHAGTSDLARHGISEYVYGHHEDRASFPDSIRGGCAMCNRFWPLDGGENSKLRNLGYFSVFYVMLDQKRTVDELTMFVEVGDSSGGFKFVPLDGPNNDNINFDFGPSNHDSKAWSIIETWMTTCFNSHPQCKLPERPISYRPTRLLKLDNAHTFRLVLGAECPSTLQYVALSHRWGTTVIKRLLQLLQSTVEHLSREQPVENLPKTFREAVDIAQHFGVDYIWIDRLCIFQDSPEDWQREASTMQDVYRNAVFSISALGAKDDEDGCFFERDPKKAAPTILRLKLTEDDEEKAFRFGLEKGWSWRLSFENEPLVQRSWVVQERLLAPRTLHFGSKQLFWECREASCCEMHPQGVYCFQYEDDIEDDRTQKADRNPDHPFLWKQLLDAPDRMHAGDQYEQLFTDWNSITNYYASRQLTVANDKLVALSGLANNMKARLQQLRPGPHRYLAGLWEEKLMDTIVWNVVAPARRALQYRAPSWSWACLDGHLNISGGCKDKETISFTSKVSVDMTYLGKEDTGEVEGGVLTLAGPCASVMIENESGRHRMFKNERNVRRIQSDGSNLYEKDEAKVRIIFDTLEYLTEKALLIWVCTHHLHDEKWYGHGLILAHVEEDKYRRLGMASRYFDNKDDARVFSAGFSQKQVSII